MLVVDTSTRCDGRTRTLKGTHGKEVDHPAVAERNVEADFLAAASGVFLMSSIFVLRSNNKVVQKQ